MNALSLQSPVSSLKGVGSRVAERLGRLGLERVEDLFFHLPLRYQDRTRLVAIGALRPFQEALVQGRIEHAEVVQRRRRALLVRLTDGTGAITLRFFHFGNSQRNQLARGQTLRVFGEARPGALGLEMVHPEYQLVSGEAADEAAPEPTLTPIYPTTEGLGQAVLRRLIGQARAYGEPAELMPAELMPEGLRYELGAALALLHAPPADADLGALATGRHPAQRRLAFEELLAHQLSLARLRAQMRDTPAPALARDGELQRRLLAALPFELTAAQRRVVGEIADDLAQPRPMLRLVQGDVGSGKTVVALAACLQAVEAGFQAALMAPTELLAEQHFRNAAGWLDDLGIRVVWLSGRQRPAAREQCLAELASGEAAVAVGTHALFQEAVSFARLGLVVIDEQHRFGVHQRLALREKAQGTGLHAHQLVMTATPIPRTLAMTAYADLDYSVIDELPPGRTPVTTVAVPDTRRPDVVERIRAAVTSGRQAYWVCTLIEESEALQCEAAEDTYAQLGEALPEVRVGLVHGRMKATEKESVMGAFKRGELDLLVATTVIEVGVDVPNASLMIIENAERLGLAQLHQLRGRVGRGATASSCVLLYHPPLGDTAKRRLQALRETSDGFEIARLDLEIRGPGELLGTRQTGMARLRVAELVRDADLLPAVQQAARTLWAQQPQAAEALIRRWLGGAERYAQV